MATEVTTLRKFLKERISKIKFEEYTTEKNELFNIILRTVSNGESDSVLVVGPSGCGKTTVIDDCLMQIKKKFCETDYQIVYLNGLVHTDDNLALREIIQQLHIEELTEEQITGSFADNLQFVLQSFKNGDKNTSRPIIFILNEFQLFCNHKNQTLLYNLFDTSKFSMTPLCIVGETSRFDVTELLEKRVSSRFSHRQILLLPESNFESRVAEFKQYLEVKKRKPALRHATEVYLNEWGESLETLIALPTTLQRIRRQLEIDPSRKAFKNVMFNLICKISDTNRLLTSKNIEEVFQKYLVDARVEYLKDLSVLELCLVISMCHHTEIFDNEPFNFEMVLEQYLKFAKRNSAVQIIQRPILLKAFERIKELELILPITLSTRNQKKEHILYNLMVIKSQVKMAVNSYTGLPTDVVQWAFSNVA